MAEELDVRSPSLYSHVASLSALRRAPASTTHVYAAPGAYTFHLNVLSIDVCHPIPGPPGVPAGPPPGIGVDLPGCLPIGPGPARPGC